MKLKIEINGSEYKKLEFGEYESIISAAKEFISDIRERDLVKSPEHVEIVIKGFVAQKENNPLQT